jgi:hypothetical protein
MTIREFSSRLSSLTGRLVTGKQFGRVGKIVKEYTDENLQFAFDALSKVNSPQNLPDPISWIQKVASSESNKEEVKNILDFTFKGE